MDLSVCELTMNSCITLTKVNKYFIALVNVMKHFIVKCFYPVLLVAMKINPLK